MKSFNDYWDERINANEKVFNDNPQLANFAYDEAQKLYEEFEKEIEIQRSFTSELKNALNVTMRSLKTYGVHPIIKGPVARTCNCAPNKEFKDD